MRAGGFMTRNPPSRCPTGGICGFISPSLSPAYFPFINLFIFKHNPGYPAKHKMSQKCQKLKKNMGKINFLIIDFNSTYLLNFNN